MAHGFQLVFLFNQRHLSVKTLGFILLLNIFKSDIDKEYINLSQIPTLKNL